MFIGFFVVHETGEEISILYFDESHFTECGFTYKCRSKKYWYSCYAHKIVWNW